MNDEHVINLLRAVAQRTPYADTDIGRAMSRGRRMRRRRHTAVGATSTLVVAGFAMLLVNHGGGPGQSVVQGAVPAATPTPSTAAEPVGKDGKPVDPAVLDKMRERASAEEANTAVLLKALGPDWYVDTGDAAAGNVAVRPGGDVVPKPGSSAASTLPDGYTAYARMMVFNADGAPSSSLASVCKPFAEKGTVNAGCVDVALPDGRVAYYAGPGPSDTGGPWSSAMYYFGRSDGSFVRIEFGVGTAAARVSAAQHQQALDWMEKYKQALAGAVADDGVLPEPDGTGSTPQVSMITDHDRDLVLMQRALGTSWTLTDGKLGLEPNWGEYKELPTLPHGNWTAPADITTISRAAFDAACGAESGATACEKRRTKDGSEVFVRTWADRDASSGEYTGESAAYFVRPDGSVLLADIELNSEQVEKVRDTDQVAGMRSWLNNLQTRLVKAVTDPEVKG